MAATQREHKGTTPAPDLKTEVKGRQSFANNITEYWKAVPQFTYDELIILSSRNPDFLAKIRNGEFKRSADVIPTGGIAKHILKALDWLDVDGLNAFKAKLDKIPEDALFRSKPPEEVALGPRIESQIALDNYKSADEKDRKNHLGGISRMMNNWPIVIDREFYAPLQARFVKAIRESNLEVSEANDEIAAEIKRDEQKAKATRDFLESKEPQTKKELDKLVSDIFIKALRDICGPNGSKIKDSIRNDLGLDRLKMDESELLKYLLANYLHTQVPILLEGLREAGLSAEKLDLGLWLNESYIRNGFKNAIEHVVKSNETLSFEARARQYFRIPPKPGDAFERNLIKYWYDPRIPVFTKEENKIAFSPQGKFKIQRNMSNFIEKLQIKDIATYSENLARFINEREEIIKDFEIKKVEKEKMDLERREAEEAKRNQNLSPEEIKRAPKLTNRTTEELLALTKPEREELNQNLIKLNQKFKNCGLPITEISSSTTTPAQGMQFLKQLQEILQPFHSNLQGFNSFQKKLAWVSSQELKEEIDPRVTKNLSDASRRMNGWVPALIDKNIREGWLVRYRELLVGMPDCTTDEAPLRIMDIKSEDKQVAPPQVISAFLALHDDFIYQAMLDLCEDEDNVKDSILEILDISSGEANNRFNEIVGSYRLNLAMAGLEQEIANDANNPGNKGKHMVLAWFLSDKFKDANSPLVTNRTQLFKPLAMLEKQLAIRRSQYGEQDPIYLAGREILIYRKQFAKDLLAQPTINPQERQAFIAKVHAATEALKNPKNIEPVVAIIAEDGRECLLELEILLAERSRKNRREILDGTDILYTSGIEALASMKELSREILRRPEKDPAEMRSFIELVKGTTEAIKTNNTERLSRAIEQAPLQESSGWAKAGAAALVVLGAAFIVAGYAASALLCLVDGGACAAIGTALGKATLFAAGLLLGSTFAFAGFASGAKKIYDYATRGPFTQAMSEGGWFVKKGKLKEKLSGVVNAGKDKKFAGEEKPAAPTASTETLPTTSRGRVIYAPSTTSDPRTVLIRIKSELDQLFAMDIRHVSDGVLSKLSDKLMEVDAKRCNDEQVTAILKDLHGIATDGLQNLYGEARNIGKWIIEVTKKYDQPQIAPSPPPKVSRGPI